MIIRVPITGKLISYNPETKVGEGSKENPIRPLDFEKLFPGAFFNWEVKGFDVESGMALVEITFVTTVTVTEVDNTNKPPEPLAWKTETDLEFFTRQADFSKLACTILGKSADELYALTGEPRLEIQTKA